MQTSARLTVYECQTQLIEENLRLRVHLATELFVQTKVEFDLASGEVAEGSTNANSDRMRAANQNLNAANVHLQEAIRQLAQLRSERPTVEERFTNLGNHMGGDAESIDGARAPS